MRLNIENVGEMTPILNPAGCSFIDEIFNNVISDRWIWLADDRTRFHFTIQ